MSLPIYSRLLNDSELPVFCLDHHFSHASAFYAEGIGDILTTFDLVVRDMPPHRNFLLAGGLEAIVQFIENLKYTEEQISFLLDHGRISPEFADYMRNFKFSGDIDAMPEGTVHFAGEPMLRITAPLIETILVTDQFMALANIDTMLLSKLARMHLALNGKKCSVGTVRSQGIDAGWRMVRNALFFDSLNFASVAAGLRMQHETGLTLNANHAFIKSFPTELEAMRAAAKHFPDSLTFMIDTYEYKQGIANAITVASELREQGKQLSGVTVDSGDLLAICKYAREEFTKAGFPNIRIVAAGNMDEYKVAELVKNGIEANVFLAVTEIATSADAPKLEIVYKMAQQEKDGSVRYTAKFAPGKLSLPGKKQVFRLLENGKIVKDVIGLEDEQLGEPLQVPIYRSGKLVYDLPSAKDLQEYAARQLELLPDEFKDVLSDHVLAPEVSERIKGLIERVRSEHIGH